MKTTPVMFLLSALLVTMVTCDGHVDAPVPNYDEAKMEGMWYIVATATNKWAPAVPKKVTPVTWSMPSGNTVTRTFKVTNDAGNCQSQSEDMTKTATAGQFTYSAGEVNYEVLVLEVDAEYEDYAFVHTAVHTEPESDANDCINMLYSRSTTVSDNILEDFKEHSKEDDNIPAGNVNKLETGTC